MPGPPGWMRTSSAGASVERVVGAEDKVLAPRDGPAAGGEAGDVPAVLGVLLRPVGEHLPGTDGVELLDTVEEEQPDVARGV